MEIFELLDKIKAEIQEEIIETSEDLESFRRKFLGSKNKLKDLFSEIRNVSADRKKEFGQKMNELKNSAQSRFSESKDNISATEAESNLPNLDLSLPAEPIPLGSRHPNAIVLNKIVEIFEKIGFEVAEEREIEDDWFNFTAMNTPEDHPARDMQDTFYLKDSTKQLLRTHTSSVQARVMTTQKPPIRIIAPGRVYRNETISARSHCQFHQVEGLYIDKNVSFADLKQTLLFFAKEMYGPEAEIRMRPSFFPFTEPSAEVDVTCIFCKGEKPGYACNICKKTTWVEILGCGMVDPQVLENCGIDSSVYSGYAFGMGIERQAMLLHNINDIRLMFENDVRFLEQFKAAF